MSNINISARLITYLKIRRVIECLIIVISLPLILPLCLIIIILIKQDTPGNIFFIQERPGINSKLFKVYKFRSMVDSSNTNFELTNKNDPRITPTGKFLRDYRLDELPQLWNILKGEMSIIGPRPVPHELFDFYKINIPGYDIRHVVPPGITGWAQINLGYTNSLEGEKLKWEYDIEYINNLGWQIDLVILKKTIGLMF